MVDFNVHTTIFDPTVSINNLLCTFYILSHTLGYYFS